MHRHFLLCLALVVFSQISFGDVIPTDEAQEAQNSKHEDLPESSLSSPPLSTDDPGTPGPLGFELNSFTELDFFKGGQSSSFGLDANLGLGERFQLRLSKELTKEDVDNQPGLSGQAATSLALKWRFYDNTSLKLAVYPSYQFDDATTPSGEVSAGRSLYIPISISKNLGPYTVLANSGKSFNLDHSEKWGLFGSRALFKTCHQCVIKL